MKGSILFIPRQIFSFLLFLFRICFRLKGYKEEEQFKRGSFYIVCTLGMLVSAFYAINDVISVPKFDRFILHISSSILMALSFVIHLIFPKFFQLFLFVNTLNIFVSYIVMFATMHYFDIWTCIDELSYLSLSLFTIVVSGNIFQKIFWTTCLLIFILSIYIAEMFFRGYEDVSYLYIFFDTFKETLPMCIQFFFCSIVLFYFLNLKKRGESLLTEVVRGIARLNLNSKSIQKLLNKPEVNMTEQETLLKKVIQNMVYYKSYLPESLLYNNNEDEDENEEERDDKKKNKNKNKQQPQQTTKVDCSFRRKSSKSESSSSSDSGSEPHRHHRHHHHHHSRHSSSSSHHDDDPTTTTNTKKKHFSSDDDEDSGTTNDEDDEYFVLRNLQNEKLEEVEEEEEEDYIDDEEERYNSFRDDGTTETENSGNSEISTTSSSNFILLPSNNKRKQKKKNKHSNRLNVHMSSFPRLEEKELTMILVNIHEYHKFKCSVNNEEFLLCQRNYVEEISKIIEDQTGITHHFSGDHIFGSFNSIRTCVDHCQNAVAAAQEILKWSQNWDNWLMADEKTNPEFLVCNIRKEMLRKRDPIELRITLVCDQVSYAFLGGERMKRFTIIGEAVTFLHAVNKFYSSYTNCILVNQKIIDRVKFHYGYELIDTDVVIDTRGFMKDNLYSINEKKNIKEGNQEWIYSIQDHLKGNGNTEACDLVEMAFENIAKENWDLARKMILKHIEIDQFCYKNKEQQETKKKEVEILLTPQQVKKKKKNSKTKADFLLQKIDSKRKITHIFGSM